MERTNDSLSLSDSRKGFLFFEPGGGKFNPAVRLQVDKNTASCGVPDSPLWDTPWFLVRIRTVSRMSVISVKDKWPVTVRTPRCPSGNTGSSKVTEQQNPAEFPGSELISSSALKYGSDRAQREQERPRIRTRGDLSRCSAELATSDNVSLQSQNTCLHVRV